MRSLRALLVVVCLFVVSSVVEAQTLTQVASLSQTFREGTTTTNSVDVSLTANVQEVLIVFNIPTAVYENTATRLAARLYRLLTATQTWQVIGGCTFNGGRYVDEDGNVDPPITCSTDASLVRGYSVRAEVETNARVRLGADVYTLQR